MRPSGPTKGEVVANDAAQVREVVRERDRQVVQHPHGLERLPGRLLGVRHMLQVVKSVESVLRRAATIRKSRRASSSPDPPKESRERLRLGAPL